MSELEDIAEDASYCTMENRSNVEDATSYAKDYLSHRYASSLDDILYSLDDYDYDCSYDFNYDDGYYDCDQYYDEIVNVKELLDRAEYCFYENEALIENAKYYLEAYYDYGNVNNFNEFVKYISNFRSCEGYF